jgi:hypothetical protein
MRKVNDYDAGASFLDARAEEEEPIDNGLMPSWLNVDTLADNATAPEYLINGILETKSHGILSGSSMSYKTFCVIKMAHSICTGASFYGHQVFNPGKVLYICGEGGGAISRRALALKLEEGGFNNNFMILERPLQIDDEVCMNWLHDQIVKIKPLLLIFDTFSSLAMDTKENDNSEVSRALKLVSMACTDADTCSLVVHHFGKDKDKGTRGASAFGANVDFEFTMTRTSEEKQTVLACKKMKDGDNFEDLYLTAHLVKLGLTGQDGTSAYSLVLKQSEFVDSLPKNQQTGFEAIKKCIIEDGEDLADGRTVIYEDKVRRCLSKSFDGTTLKFNAFAQVLPGLISKELVKKEGRMYWI